MNSCCKRSNGRVLYILSWFRAWKSMFCIFLLEMICSPTQDSFLANKIILLTSWKLFMSWLIPMSLGRAFKVSQVKRAVICSRFKLIMRIYNGELLMNSFARVVCDLLFEIEKTLAKAFYMNVSYFHSFSHVQYFLNLNLDLPSMVFSYIFVWAYS